MLLPWIVCFCGSLFLFYEDIQGYMFASIADNIMRDFAIQADQMAYLSSAYYAANVIFLFISGYMLDTFSTKKIILIAMSFCIISIFILGHTHSFYVALLCRFVTGIGSAFCFLGPVRLVSRWFSPQKMGMVTGIIVTIGMLGGLVAQYPLATIVADHGWRESLNYLGWFGIIILLCMSIGIMDKKNNNTHHLQQLPWSTVAKQAYFNGQTIRAALYTSLMNMAIAVFGAMMGSLYLMQKVGITKEQAASINSMLFLGTIIGGPLVGWFSDQLGKRLIPMKIGTILSLITILLILFTMPSINIMKILFFLLGLFTATQVISYALVAENSSPLLTASSVSIISIFTQGGYIVYQNLFSFLLMYHGEMKYIHHLPVYSLGDYQFAAITLPIGLIGAFFILSGLHESHKAKS